VLVDVLLLRDHGRRLRRRELTPPVRGVLVVGEGHGAESSFQREMLTARLCVTRGANSIVVDALLPLFDVRLLRATGDTLVLIGIELSSARARDTEWRTTESVQIWRCTLVAPSKGHVPGATL
jgi:hypothetical protein